METKRIKGIDVVVGILGIILVMSIAIFFSRMSEYNSVQKYVGSEEVMMERIEYRNYTGLVEATRKYRLGGVQPTKTYEECYAVADYFEAASWYKAYSQDGNTQKASEQKKKMEDAISRVGELSFAIEDINKRLELEE